MPSRRIAISFTLASATFAALIGTSLTGCGSDNKDTGTGSTSNPQVATGEQAVTQFACKSCHGNDLSGDTKAQPNSMAYPANLTPDADTGIGGWQTATIVTAILDGTDDEGATLCIMPKFRAAGMTEDQANAIAVYLKSIPAVTKMIPESDCGGAK